MSWSKRSPQALSNDELAPERTPADVLEAVRVELMPDQAVEVVLDVVPNAINKIAVALGLDAAEVNDGIQLFRVDADSLVTIV